MRKLYSVFLTLIVIASLSSKTIGQTNPALHDLSTGSYTFTGFGAGTTTTYPTSMQGHNFSAEPTTAILTNGTADRALTANSGAVATGSIRNEIANGISLLNSGSNHIGAIVVGINTTGRSNILVTFTAAQVNDVNTRVNALRLQYRVGNSGSYTDVSPTTEYLSTLSGTNTPQTFTNIALPAGAENQAEVYIRWIYYTPSGSGGRDRIRLDDITISSSAAATPSVAISAGGITAGNVNQGDLNVVLQRYNLTVSSADATINGLTVTTAGTYVASDIINLKAWYSADNTFDAGDVLLSTKSTSLDAGAQAFPSFTQAITSGTTGYIFVTTDVAASATPGSTINIATTDFSDISFAGTVNKTGTDPVDAGGVKTFVAVTPDVVLSSPSPAVAAASITQNTTNNIIYRFDLAVTTANATLDGVTITTTGTYVAADLTNMKAWYSADNSFDAGSDVLLSTKTASLEPGIHEFPAFSSQVITNGTTGTIFITADVPCTATSEAKLTVSAITTADISFVSANKTGTANAGGEQTIASATPVNVTGAAASSLNASSSVSWNGPTGCFDEVMIVAATAANNGTPSGNGGAYTDGNGAFGSGTALDNGFVVYKGTASPQVVTGLTNGVTYHFKIFTRNDANWSAGVEVTATPVAQVQPGDIVINQMSPDYGAATDEYVELVNTTGSSIDLSNLKLNYRSSTGGGNFTQTLSGTLLPHSFWLLSTNSTVTINSVSLNRDGTLGAGGFAGTNGQIAILRVSDDVKIDGVGYGTLTGGTYAEGTTSSNPPADGGIKRVIDGADAGANNTDFTTVTNANIHLRNSSSRLANTGASIAAGTYTDISVTGNSSIAGTVNITGAITWSDVNGELNLAGNNLVLKSTSTGTARIGVVPSGKLTGATNVTVERYIGFGAAKRAWRMVSSPVSGVNLFDSWQEAGVNNNTGYGTLITGTGAGFDAGNTSIKTWNANAWVTNQLTATNTGDITDYQGYMLFVRGDRSVAATTGSTPGNTTLRANGDLRKGQFPNYTTVTSGITNFTLLGNPYPSAISFEAIHQAHNSLINFYSWNPAAAGANGVGAYNYIERNGGTYRVTPQGGGQTNTPSAAFIPMGAAVLIEGPAAGGDVAVTLEESFKTSNTTTVNYFRTNSADRNLAVNLVRNNTTLDGFRIAFDNSHLNDNTDDAIKLWNNTENMSLGRNGSFFIVERRKDITANDTAFVKIYNLPQDSYQLDFYPDQFNNVQAFLLDAYTNTSTPIDVTAASAYSFVVNGDAASKSVDRFMIVFRPSSVLPVSFTNIKAYEKGNAIEVAWNVAGESDIHHYEVEKSTDGRNFSLMASVKTKGNENSNVAYTAIDNSPITGNNYYRVKSVSMGNEIKYTSIVNVRLGKNGEGISVYPNPVKGNSIGVQLTNLAKGLYTLNVYNTAGQVIVTKMIQHGGGSASEQIILPTSSTKGVYQLEVRSEGSRFVQSIILQ